jgi:hypothetical protein
VQWRTSESDGKEEMMTKTEYVYQLRKMLLQTWETTGRMETDANARRSAMEGKYRLYGKGDLFYLHDTKETVSISYGEGDTGSIKKGYKYVI